MLDLKTPKNKVETDDIFCYLNNVSYSAEREKIVVKVYCMYMQYTTAPSNFVKRTKRKLVKTVTFHCTEWLWLYIWKFRRSHIIISAPYMHLEMRAHIFPWG